MSSQTTLAQLPVGQIGFGAMRITGPGIWGAPMDEGEQRQAARDARYAARKARKRKGR
jgi:hypothetical protein